MALTCGDILKFVAAFFLPPLGVFLELGTCNKDFWINVLLTLLGYIPGAFTGGAFSTNPPAVFFLDLRILTIEWQATITVALHNNAAARPFDKAMGTTTL